MQLSETTIDYGRLTRGGMLENQSGPSLSLGKRQMTLTVTCQKPTGMWLKARGITGVDKFAFGSTGQLMIYLSHVQLDGAPVNLGLASTVGILPAESKATMVIGPGAIVAPTTAGEIVKGRHFSAQVEVDAIVDDATTRVGTETVIEGRVNFELVEG
ncbi:hypothetical protein ACVBEF_12935 [Glaciimonas sp. GG7]